MTTQPKVQVKKPKNLDLEKAEKMVLEVIAQNVEWVKEMAKK
jgi:hypothetical protein